MNAPIFVSYFYKDQGVAETSTTRSHEFFYAGIDQSFRQAKPNRASGLPALSRERHQGRQGGVNR
jgi:hypothetical protein